MISQEGNKINEHAIHTVRTPNDDSEKYETSEDLRNDRHSDLTDITNVEGDHEKAHGLPTPEEDLPDGGYGWFIILGAFMVQVTSFGTATSWGKSIFLISNSISVSRDSY
ncbi:uncharacterized protein BYT42DRAFT_40938 [Radiomyces spectabilis]|uniref:uncharacterized protein n=1 Tax=Radiomyces spectabilis TaxID=64574 RepID=UPI00222008AE|nr:uncharacterized protein BYT42DRAFT_40938 [Radiomyces spectabilis]KAI8394331.1 hypothetical protein BYT42DRAFT_40938 [Radiomyces spectabilis]